MEKDVGVKNVHEHIHGLIRKRAPKIIHKSRRVFSFKYLKICLFISFIVLSYYLFSSPAVRDLVSQLGEFSYVGFFIMGALISFGFSAPFSAGFFLVSNPENIFLAAIIGGFGAAAGDMIIFKAIKISFMDEFKELSKKGTIKEITKIVKKNFSIKIQHYLIYVFAGIFIISPLPDEVAVSMLAGLTTIKARVLAVIAFVLHTLALLILFTVGKVF